MYHALLHPITRAVRLLAVGALSLTLSARSGAVTLERGPGLVPDTASARDSSGLTTPALDSDPDLSRVDRRSSCIEAHPETGGAEVGGTAVAEALRCRERISAYKRGKMESRCPSIYCTVTTCRFLAGGCLQVIYTFYRGPGQKPWVVKKPAKCAVTKPKAPGGGAGH